LKADTGHAAQAEAPGDRSEISLNFLGENTETADRAHGIGRNCQQHRGVCRDVTTGLARSRGESTRPRHANRQ
jgi:hypothetical protein